MRYVTGASRAHRCSEGGGGGSLAWPNKHSRKGNRLLTWGGQLVLELRHCPPCPHSISFSFFIFMGIVVVVVGVLVIIEG